MDNNSRSASPREPARPQQRPPSPPNGFDNRAYHHDENDDPNHNHHPNESYGANGKHEPNGDTKALEAVNLELINLAPKNGIAQKSISKKEVEVDMSATNPYDEYFVPVNEHKKYMRGEKLYVTADKRGEKSGCKRPLCWTIIGLVVAAIVVLIVLAATGLLFSNAPTPVEPYNATISSARALGGIGAIEDHSTHDHSAHDHSAYDHSAHDHSTHDHSTHDHSEHDPNANDYSEHDHSVNNNNEHDHNVNEQEHGPENAMNDQVVSEDHDSSMYVANTLEGELKIDNHDYTAELSETDSKAYRDLTTTLSEAIRKALFDRETLENGDHDISVEIVQLKKGSVIVTYRVHWKPKTSQDNSNDVITSDSIMSTLNNYLDKNDRMLNVYHIAEEKPAQRVLDQCQLDNNNCEFGCEFNEKTLDFTCTCPQGQVLNMDDTKKCVVLFEQPRHRVLDFNQEAEHGTSKPISEEDSKIESVHVIQNNFDWKDTTGRSVETTTQQNPDLTFSHIFGNPTHEPTAEPEPEPTSEPEPEPSSEPSPQPEPKSASEYLIPVAEPTAEPTAEPAAEPAAELATEPSAEPTVEPAAEPTADVAAEPIAEPTAEPTSQPTAEPKPEPVAEPTAEPAAEPTAEPALEPTAEPAAEPVAIVKSILEHIAEPTSEPTAEPSAEPTAEPSAEPTAEPASEPTAEPKASEQTPKLVPIPIAEPTTESAAEPTAEPAPEPTVEPAAEPSIIQQGDFEGRNVKNIWEVKPLEPEPKAVTESEPAAEPTAEPQTTKTDVMIGNINGVVIPITNKHETTTGRMEDTTNYMLETHSDDSDYLEGSKNDIANPTTTEKSNEERNLTDSEEELLKTIRATVLSNNIFDTPEENEAFLKEHENERKRQHSKLTTTTTENVIDNLNLKDDVTFDFITKQNQESVTSTTNENQPDVVATTTEKNVNKENDETLTKVEEGRSFKDADDVKTTTLSSQTISAESTSKYNTIMDNTKENLNITLDMDRSSKSADIPAYSESSNEESDWLSQPVTVDTKTTTEEMTESKLLNPEVILTNAGKDDFESDYLNNESTLSDDNMPMYGMTHDYSDSNNENINTNSIPVISVNNSSYETTTIGEFLYKSSQKVEGETSTTLADNKPAPVWETSEVETKEQSANNDTAKLLITEVTKHNNTAVNNLNVTIYEISRHNNTTLAPNSAESQSVQYHDHETEMNPFLPEIESNKHLVQKLVEGHDLESINNNETQTDNVEEQVKRVIEELLNDANTTSRTDTTEATVMPKTNDFITSEEPKSTTTESIKVVTSSEQSKESGVLTNSTNTVAMSDLQDIEVKTVKSEKDSVPLSTFLSDTSDLPSSREHTTEDTKIRIEPRLEIPSEVESDDGYLSVQPITPEKHDDSEALYNDISDTPKKSDRRLESANIQA